MIIRRIEQKDIRSVLNIYNWYIENTTNTFETERLNFAQFRDRVQKITAFYPWVVLEDQGIIRGYAYLSSFNPRSAYQWTADLSLYVDHQFLHQGYGSLLFQKIEQLAIQQGLVNLVSIITEQNCSSMDFHKKHGFKAAGFLEQIGYKNTWLGASFWLKQIQAKPETPVSIEAFHQ